MVKLEKLPDRLVNNTVILCNIQLYFQELKKHKKRKDAWMALNGAVYNVTHYMDFHPGGWDELVKGAGKDATDMFNEVHKWVNYQGLLEACLVGKLVDGPSEPEPETLPSLPPPGVTNRLTIKQKVTNFFSGFCTGKKLPVECLMLKLCIVCFVSDHIISFFL